MIFQESQWQVIEQVLLQMERRGLMPLSASTVEPLQNGLLQFGLHLPLELAYVFATFVAC